MSTYVFRGEVMEVVAEPIGGLRLLRAFVEHEFEADLLDDAIPALVEFRDGAVVDHEDWVEVRRP